MARRRGPPFGLISAGFAVVAVVAIAASMVMVDKRAAPKDPGVCWRMSLEGDQPKFNRIAGDLLNLETCAAYLERIYLSRGGEVQGAYQGRFIFVDSKSISSSASLEGSRWKVFYAPQRQNLDARLRAGGTAPTVAMMPAR